MNKINFQSKLLLIIAILTFGFTACSKKKTALDDYEVAAAKNLNTAEIEDDIIQTIADQAATTGDITNLRVNTNSISADNVLGCATVTRDTLATPKKITVDFGTTGCENRFGDIRKGKLIITYTGSYTAVGTEIHIVSENYYVNENKIDIHRTITNLGENTNGNLEFAIQSERVVTFPDGVTSRSTTANKTREWISGRNTPLNFSDDVYKVTGTATHTSKRGILYDVTTITPLTRIVSCREFVSGEMKIIRHGRTDRYGFINFGNGDCDNTATVTLDNGSSYNIDLRH